MPVSIKMADDSLVPKRFNRIRMSYTVAIAIDSFKFMRQDCQVISIDDFYRTML